MIMNASGNIPVRKRLYCKKVDFQPGFTYYQYKLSKDVRVSSKLRIRNSVRAAKLKGLRAVKKPTWSQLSTILGIRSGNLQESQK